MSLSSKKRRWQLQDAKNRFSELVDEAERTGPQLVTRRGQPAVVVLSVADHEKLSKRRSGRTLVDVLLSAPKLRGGLKVERNRDSGRDVNLE